MVSTAATGVVHRNGRVVNIQLRERLRDTGDLGGSGVANWLTDVGRKVNDELPMNDKVVVGLLEVQCKHLCRVVAMLRVPVSTYYKLVKRRTMTAQFQIDNIPNSDVNDAEKPLVTFLEFTLVKNLDGNYGRLLDIASIFRGSDENRRAKGRLERLTYQNSHSNRDSRSS